MESIVKQALAHLHGQHPLGFSYTADERLIPATAATEIASFEMLGSMAREPQTLQFDLPGPRAIQIKIRPLESVEANEHDKIGAENKPPKREIKPARGNQPAEFETNWDDPEYKRIDAETYELKRAFIIDKGTVGFEVPGETLEKKRAFLKQFPPRVLEALRGAILAITSDPIATASFISSAG